MTDKIVVIISTSDPEKALTGMMYAINTVKNRWMEEVKLFFFGPAEELLLRDLALQQSLKDYHAINEAAVACKFLADRNNTGEQIAALGIKVEYVGKMISNLIKDGYTPMVW
ncbi:MAG: hypothetical protein U9R17_19185 [Thermodesulfobacteriota bacterium]|nr:hypothetical protein [Thermodesulfobacteriota bacterium]